MAAADLFDLFDYRRQVQDLYAEVRNGPPDEVTWKRWRHPSRVHSDLWSCPLSPAENSLDFGVRAGERL